jgi:hypothetical protein
MPKIADRVKETTTTTGTGDYTLSGTAPTGYQTFANAFGSGSSIISYAVTDGTNWEVGKGTFNGTTGLTRDVVRSSSNSNNAVSWGSGSKDIWCNVSAEFIDNANIGLLVAQVAGQALT